MPRFEFMLRQRPVSAQTSNRKQYQAWKRVVRDEAERVWSDRPAAKSAGVRLTLVYLCNEFPVDVDNIVKPIQDALTGLIYADDTLVTDVEIHRRFVTEPIDILRVPPLLAAAVLAPGESVYVRIDDAIPLEEYL